MIKIVIESDSAETAADFVKALGDTRTITRVGEVEVTRPSGATGPVEVPALKISDDAPPASRDEALHAGDGADDESLHASSAENADPVDPFAAVSEPDESDLAALPATVVEARALIVAVLVVYTNQPKASRAELFAAMADCGSAQGKIRAARELAIANGLMTVVGTRGPHTVTELGKLFARTTPAAEAKPAAATAARTEPTGDGTPPTIEKLKLVLTQVVKAQGTDAARAILEVFGAQNLSGVAENRRAELMAAMLAKLPDPAGA